MPWVKRILAVGKIRRAVLGGGSALEFAGYSIAYAEDVETACELMSSIKFDLIVLSRKQKRALPMMMEIKQRHPGAVLAMIHPYPEEDSPPIHLPPKSATLHTDDLISELRFLFDVHGGKMASSKGR